MQPTNTKTDSSFSAQSILKQLDACAAEFNYPVLDNGYIYPANSRLSVYGDAARWVLLIEVVGYHYRMRGHGGIENCLYFFGNCLPFEPGMQNFNMFTFTSDSDEGETFTGDALNPAVGSMLLNGKKVPVSHDPEYYTSRGVQLANAPEVKIWEFVRAINVDYEEEFLALEEEIRSRIPDDLPLMVRMDNWYHNDLAAGEKPSENETFQMLAHMLEKGDVELYQPTKPANNHWTNWPVGGTL
ncbi:hypothetical protein SAMN05421788_11369 [Filimonas lacunae]|uniref:Uncharacterized protein n=1 Tax=Filimonas lacunae TaxID=477680 RepID=A0A173MBS3_9BACT|nr:hypothetical protein [Filimonas lacunae]BAV04976.1 hypothetical protein FLA_0981 [Filimonas lacunae]SIT33709.1 hypothetical protein SAMN05421788_11369 [Filimonas lacunae]